MDELGGAFANIAVSVVLFALLLWALYFAFGPVVLGIPSMIGVLVIIAGVRVFSNAGLEARVRDPWTDRRRARDRHGHAARCRISVQTSGTAA